MPIRWFFMLDPDLPCPCDHVNFVAKSLCDDEDEFLFSPYSVFQVVRCVWQANATCMNPHEIHLRVMADNAQERDDLPLAPWY